ncbi:hypothetical protein HKX48_007932, partial [Thoreauomyces humboldtii]
SKLLESLQTAEKEREDLSTRHAAALELLGERTERVEELQADIADMKVIFKQQLTELMVELDEVRRASGRE